MIFRDRREAGRLVADRLGHYRGRGDVMVLALPRGGVVNGFEIASRLGCPLDIIIIRKIGFPGQPELAVGAVAENGAVILNERIVAFGVPEEYIKRETERLKKEIERRKSLYRGGRGLPDLTGRTVIIVDDGVATGATLKAAIQAVKEENPARLVAALPVASVEAEESIRKMVDEWVCLQTPADFMAIGSYYEDFEQVSDEEVMELLGRKAGAGGGA
ncbi:MAG: phosphoribosyltransferase [Thermodesulfovibrionales bacterium]